MINICWLKLVSLELICYATINNLMHHHKTFNSFLDKYLEVSFLLPTSHLNFLPVCLRNLVFSVIPSHCDIINISPPPLSKSFNMFKSLPSSHTELNKSYYNLVCLSPCCLQLSLFFTVTHHKITIYAPSLSFYTSHSALDHCSHLK